MIRLEVEPYCEGCLIFDPDVILSQKQTRLFAALIAIDVLVLNDIWKGK